jgi:hypothetical protein
MYNYSERPDGEESWLNKHLLKIGLAILFLGIVLIASAPYIFTQFSFTYNLADKGTIGDAIGGTTAPIASLVGSILVFLSLYAQIQANRLVLTEFKEERDRYEQELKYRKAERNEELDKYSREEAERIKDKTTQQQDEMFRTLLDLIQNQNQELINLNYEGIKGLDAIETIAGIIYSREDTPYFILIEDIVSNLKSAYNVAEESKLRLEQKKLLAEQISLIVSKIHAATFKFREAQNSFGEAAENVAAGKSPSDTPLTPFLDSLSEFQIKIKEIKENKAL